MKRKNISPERKTIYYVGMVVMILGFLSFFSVFITGALNFGDFSNFEENARSSMLRAFVGMALIIAGAVMMGVGARGLAGSGVVLDPEKARRDVEPWSRMVGGVINDALDETDLKLGKDQAPAELPFDEKLRRLHQLCQEGLITKEEYDKEKQEILDNN